MTPDAVTISGIQRTLAHAKAQQFVESLGEEVAHGQEETQEGRQGQALLTDEVEILMRPATAEELRFVQASWARCVWARGESAVQTYDAHGKADAPPAERHYTSIGSPRRPRHVLLASEYAAQAHRMLVDWLLSLPGTHVVVATLPDLPEPMGWACFNGPILHFVFVRGDCRKQRVAARLVHHTGCSAASHVTPSGRALLRHMRSGG